MDIILLPVTWKQNLRYGLPQSYPSWQMGCEAIISSFDSFQSCLSQTSTNRASVTLTIGVYFLSPFFILCISGFFVMLGERYMHRLSTFRGLYVFLVWLTQWHIQNHPPTISPEPQPICMQPWLRSSSEMPMLCQIRWLFDGDFHHLLLPPHYCIQFYSSDIWGSRERHKREKNIEVYF